jgi:hypothetical protein
MYVNINAQLITLCIQIQEIWDLFLIMYVWMCCQKKSVIILSHFWVWLVTLFLSRMMQDVGTLRPDTLTTFDVGA